MGLDFIDRTLRTTGIVILVLLPFSLYYFGVWPTLAAFSGAVWGMLNLLFLTGLVKATLRPEGADKMTAIAVLLIKFPVPICGRIFPSESPGLPTDALC